MTDAINGDIQEGGVGDPIHCYIYPSGGKWYLKADIRSHNTHEDWGVQLILVSTKCSHIWGTL